MTDKEYLNSVWPEWSLEEPVGKGSSGTVYKATRKHGHIVSESAIKIIRLPFDEDEIKDISSSDISEENVAEYYNSLIEEFENEIMILESFKGTQNIVSIEDYKIIKKETGFGWIILIRTELLTPLNTYLEKHKLSEKDVLRLGSDICSALELCSSKSIVHRDIKPENIFVNKFGSFKLGDFGIAKSTFFSAKTYYFRGSANYIAPEILQKQSFDKTSDIYSLGILLYKLLNKNRFPFVNSEGIFNPVERETALNRRLSGEALPAPSEASEKASEIILRAAQFDPARRYPDVSLMKKDLEDASGIGSVPISGSKKSRLEKALFISVPIVLAVIALTVCLFSVHRHSFGEEFFFDEFSHWYECAECNENSEHQPHVFSDITVTVPATHNNAGIGQRTCTVCGYIQSEELPAEAHIYSDTFSYDNTHHWNECECGSKTGISEHVFSDWSIISPATHTATGAKERYCTVCGFSEQVTISKEEHTPDDVFSFDDLGHWKNCPCGEKTNAEDHLFGELITTVPATCQSTGHGYTECTVCGYKKTVVLPQADHIPSEKWYYSEEKHWHICSDCDSMTDEGDHVFDDNGYCIYCSYFQIASKGLEFSVEGDFYTVSGIGTCTDKAVIIPAYYNGKKVTGIGAMAFADCKHISSVKLPDTVISIGDKAFINCTALASVNVPSKLQNFGSQIFYCCSSLTTVYYNSSFVPQNDNNVLIHPSISTVVFGCKKIPAYCCRNCTNIKNVVIESGTTSVGFCAFYGCCGLVSVSIPDTVTEIEDCAFFKCSSMSKLDLPSSLVSVGDRAFASCSSLEAISALPVLESAGEAVFEGCTALTSVTLANGIATIPDKLFKDCIFLKKVVFPESIRYIGISAFENTGIDTLTIPYGVKKLSANAFANCKALKSVDLSDTVMQIGDKCFANCPKLAEVTLSDILSAIPDNCFDSDTALTEILLPESITSIGKCAFRNTGLIKIVIPVSVYKLSTEVFSDCTKLTEIALHSGIARIEKNAFSGTENISAIIFDGTQSEWASVILEPGWYAYPDKINVIFTNKK